jgi:hypothetical protein
MQLLYCGLLSCGTVYVGTIVSEEYTASTIQTEMICFSERLPPTFTLISCSTYSTLKMEAVCSSETSVDFQRSTRRYVPEDSNLQTFPSSILYGLDRD